METHININTIFKSQPVARRGNIVMNTPEQLQLAFEEYPAGTFVEHLQSKREK